MIDKEQIFEVSLVREGAYRSVSAALEAVEKRVSDEAVPVRVLVAPGSIASESRFAVRT